MQSLFLKYIRERYASVIMSFEPLFILGKIGSTNATRIQATYTNVNKPEVKKNQY